jgi:diguanylate cyclase (GGDEF)-like protein
LFVIWLVIILVSSLLPIPPNPLGVMIGLLVLLTFLVLYGLLKRGQVRRVGVALPASLFGLITSILWGYDRLHSPVASGYVLVIVVAAMTLGARGALGYVGLSLVALGSLYWADLAQAHSFSPAPMTGVRAWLIYAGVFGVVGALLRMLMQSQQTTLQHLRLIQTAQADQARELELSLQAERRRAHQMEFLAEMARRLDGLENPQDMITEVARRLHEGFAFEQVAIFLVEQDALVLKATAGLFPESHPLGLRLKPNERLVGEVGNSGQTRWVSDARLEPDDGARLARGSEVAVPLRLSKNVVGVLNVKSARPQAFDYADVRLLESLADLMVAALQSSQMVQRLRERIANEHQHTAELEALRQASLKLTANLEWQPTLEALLEYAQKFIDASDAVLYTYDGQNLKFAAVRWAETYQGRVVTPPRVGGLTHSVAVSGQKLVIPNVNQHPLYANWKWGGAVISLPLRFNDRVRGVMNLACDHPREFAPNEVRVLELLADQAAIALENARLFQAERDQREWAEALRQASLVLTSSLDFDTILDRLLEEVARFVPYDQGNIMLVDETGQRCQVVRWRGYERFGPQMEASAQSLAFEIAQTPNLRRLLTDHHPHLISDVASDPEWVHLPAFPPLGSWLGAPLVLRGRMFAMFSLEKMERNFYEPRHAERLEAFLGPAALAFENARLFAEEQRHAREQQLLFAATRDFTAGLSEDAVMQAVAAHAVTALRASSCTISLWERARDAVVTVLDYHAPDSQRPVEPTGAWYALADYPLTRLVLERRQPRLVQLNDPTGDAAEQQLLRQLNQGALMMLPITAGNRVWGLVEIYRSRAHNAFSEADLQLAQNLTAQAAVALDNARLHSAVKENVRELDALVRANEALFSTLEIESLLNNILAAAKAAIPMAKKGTILLRGPNPSELRLATQIGYADPRMQQMEWAGAEGYGAQALSENRAVLINDIQQEALLHYTGALPEMQAVRAVVAAPLRPKGQGQEPLGVISLDADQPNVFTETDLRLLAAFANTAALAIENARLHSEVQRLAVTDGLTNIANHRALMQTLHTEISRAARYRYEVSLVIMDIDAFKKYNDTFGHLAGNERLTALALLLSDSVRYPDLPARFGGEEFALLLPHTGKTGALVLAERIRAAAEAAAAEAAPETARADTWVSGYTLSMGVASFPSDAHTANDLLRAADDAELAAKAAGKNRVLSAPELKTLAVELPPI